MARRKNPPHYRCHDCGYWAGPKPFKWWMSETEWLPFCAGCHFARWLEIDAALHVAVAREICRAHAYTLDQAVR
jgi:hypothetical protein